MEQDGAYFVFDARPKKEILKETDFQNNKGFQTITDFLRFHTEENCNENIFLNILIKSFKSEEQRPKNVFPSETWL